MLPASGTMSLSQARTEFSKSLPMPFSALYAAVAGVPISGVMSLSQFYGKSAGASAPSTPRWGVGALSSYTEANVLALCSNAHTYTTGQIFTPTTSTTYIYFIVPVAYNPIFVDQASGFPGGWDGASWLPLGDIGGGTGPVALTIAGQSWKIYRTDFDSSGVSNWKVNY